MSPRPDGFQRSYVLPTQDPQCALGIGFDVERGVVERFLIQLQLAVEPENTADHQIARIDHNPAARTGHDVRFEGVHVDVVLPSGDERTLHPEGSGQVRNDLGLVIDQSIEYVRSNVAFFKRIHYGDANPGSPPRWID